MIILHSAGRQYVIYDAEHWFDGYKHNLIMRHLRGCDRRWWYQFCAIPPVVLQSHQKFSFQIRPDNRAIPPKPVSIHTHNDLAKLPNALAAVFEGARTAQGTIKVGGNAAVMPTSASL